MLNVLPPRPFRIKTLRKICIFLLLIIIVVMMLSWYWVYKDALLKQTIKNQLFKVQQAESLVAEKAATQKIDLRNQLEKKESIEKDNKKRSQLIDYFYGLKNGYLLQRINIDNEVVRAEVDMTTRLLLINLQNDLNAIGVNKLVIVKVGRNEESFRKYRVTLSAVFSEN